MKSLYKIMWRAQSSSWPRLGELNVWVFAVELSHMSHQPLPNMNNGTTNKSKPTPTTITSWSTVNCPTKPQQVLLILILFSNYRQLPIRGILMQLLFVVEFLSFGDVLVIEKGCFEQLRNSGLISSYVHHRHSASIVQSHTYVKWACSLINRKSTPFLLNNNVCIYLTGMW